MPLSVQLLGWHPVAGADGTGPSIQLLVIAGQWVAVAVVVVSAIWIARLHRRLLGHYLEVQALLSDLLAALNLSLARCAQGAGEADLREIERIQAAVREAVSGIARASGGR